MNPYISTLSRNLRSIQAYQDCVMDTVQSYVAANLPEGAATPEHAEELEACVFYGSRHLQIDKFY